MARVSNSLRQAPRLAKRSTSFCRLPSESRRWPRFQAAAAYGTSLEHRFSSLGRSTRCFAFLRARGRRAAEGPARTASQRGHVAPRYMFLLKRAGDVRFKTPKGSLGEYRALGAIAAQLADGQGQADSECLTRPLLRDQCEGPPHCGGGADGSHEPALPQRHQPIRNTARLWFCERCGRGRPPRSAIRSSSGISDAVGLGPELENAPQRGEGGQEVRQRLHMRIRRWSRLFRRWPSSPGLAHQTAPGAIVCIDIGDSR
jgi:hypothetical protein